MVHHRRHLHKVQRSPPSFIRFAVHKPFEGLEGLANLLIIIANIRRPGSFSEQKCIIAVELLALG
jgi:hypothetical protein